MASTLRFRKHEVNIPGAHDACTQHMLQAMSELKAIGEPYAECQDMQYQDMLEKGVRILDLRLNNWYLEDIALPAWAEVLLAIFGFAAWVIERIVEWIIEQTDAKAAARISPTRSAKMQSKATRPK